MTAISSDSLNRQELKELNWFLSIAYHDPLEVQLTYTHGFLTAMVSAPHLIMPSVWQSMLLKETAFFSSRHAAHIVSLLMRLDEEISQKLYHGARLEPLLFSEGRAVSLDEADSKAVSAWCRGYLTGATYDPLWHSDAKAEKNLIPLFLLARDKRLEKKWKGHLLFNRKNFSKEMRMQYRQEQERLPQYIKYFFDYWSKEREKAIPIPTFPSSSKNSNTRRAFS